MVTKKVTTKNVEEKKSLPVQTKKKILTVTLGASLQAGQEISEEIYKDLIGAGFTDERLFGKQ